MNETFTVRLPEDQKAFLNKLAGTTEQSRDTLVSSIVRHMVDNYDYVMGKVVKGEADMVAGRVHIIEDVEASTQAIIDRYVSKSA
jgi:predicted transcriptional regulator